MCVQDLFDFLKVKLEFRGRDRNFQEMSGKRQIFFFDEQCLEGVHRGEDNIVGVHAAL